MKFQKNGLAKTNIPKKEEYEAIADKIGETISKIENWFKHQRRKFMIEGDVNNYKKRRLLNDSEKIILEETFRLKMKPSKQKMHELAQRLKFTNKVISNWFSYRRKKFLKLNEEKENEQQKQQKKIPESRSDSDFSFPSLQQANTLHQTNCTGPSDSVTSHQNSIINKSETSNDEENEKIENKETIRKKVKITTENIENLMQKKT